CACYSIFQRKILRANSTLNCCKRWPLLLVSFKVRMVFRDQVFWIHLRLPFSIAAAQDFSVTPSRGELIRVTLIERPTHRLCKRPGEVCSVRCMKTENLVGFSRSARRLLRSQ